MITQPLEWDYDRSRLVCKTCRGDASNTEMPHRDDCTWIAGLVAAAVEAEWARLVTDLTSHADSAEATVPPDGTSHARDQLLFVAGMRRAIELVQYGDRPMTASGDGQ